MCAVHAVANDNEAPESWLEWTGWRKLVFGVNAHRRWHYTRGAPPVRYVKWYVRSAGAPVTETFANLCRSGYAYATGGEPFWVTEAREAAEEEAAAAKADGDAHADAAPSERGSAASGSRSTTSSVRSAVGLRAYKRRVMLLGIGATAVCWALFVWFIFTCACAAALPCACRLRVCMRC